MTKHPIRYRLSNRQRKELTIRGAQLRIAIPCDVELADEDPIQFARDALIDVDLRYFIDADIHEILVRPQVGDTGDLTGVLGVIIEPDLAAGYVVSTVSVLLVTLRAVPQPRSVLPPQWPAIAILPDGSTWPPQAPGADT